MVSRRGLEGPLHPIKRRALQGPLVRQKAVPVVDLVAVQTRLTVIPTSATHRSPIQNPFTFPNSMKEPIGFMAWHDLLKHAISLTRRLPGTGNKFRLQRRIEDKETSIYAQTMHPHLVHMTSVPHIPRGDVSCFYL